MCEQLEVDVSKFGGIYTDSMNRGQTELCDKEHRNVCRDIENLNATYGQMGLPKVGQTPYTHEQNGQTFTPQSWGDPLYR